MDFIVWRVRVKTYLYEHWKKDELLFTVEFDDHGKVVQAIDYANQFEIPLTVTDDLIKVQNKKSARSSYEENILRASLDKWFGKALVNDQELLQSALEERRLSRYRESEEGA